MSDWKNFNPLSQESIETAMDAASVHLSRMPGVLSTIQASLQMVKSGMYLDKVIQRADPMTDTGFVDIMKELCDLKSGLLDTLAASTDSIMTKLDATSRGTFGINDLSFEANQTAIEKGWWMGDRGIPECLALIHSEVSKALEAYRNDDMELHLVDKKASPPSWPIS